MSGELITPREYFDNTISQDFGNSDPLLIVHMTKNNIGLRLRNELSNTRSIDAYLRGVTIPFMLAVRDAAPLYYEESEPRLRTTALPQIQEEGSVVQDDRMRSAVDLFNVVFAAMPDTFKHPLLPMGYSRKGVLRPPTTARQMRTRIGEMGFVLSEMVKGQYDIGKEYPSSPILRTLAFFKVGAELPVKQIPKISDEELLINERNAKLLDGIVVTTVIDDEKAKRRKELDEYKIEKNTLRTLLEGIEIDLP